VDFNEDSPAERSVDLAIEQILAYLRRYPQAADTLDGIAVWWLGDRAAAIPTEALTLALERLAKKGVLAGRTLPCGNLLWYALHVPPANPVGNGS
jgi:hypothetical protein